MMKRLRITVEGTAYDVTVEELDAPEGATAPLAAAPSASARPPAPATPRPAAPPPAPAAPALPVGEGAVVSPLAGTVVKLAVANGQSVAIGDVLVVLEAMKMNTPIAATRAGQVTAIAVAVGTTVSEGQVLLTLG